MFAVVAQRGAVEQALDDQGVPALLRGCCANPWNLIQVMLAEGIEARVQVQPARLNLQLL